MLTVAVLAGGFGTRLKPLTDAIPKSMIQIHGRPFVHWQMQMMSEQGINDVVFCLGNKSAMISDFIGDGSQYAIRVRYSFDGEQQLGTGGALKKSLPLLGDRFMVVYGDSYPPVRLQSVEDAFHQAKKPALMTVFLNEGRFDSSNADFSEGMVKKYVKGENAKDLRYVDYGIGCYESTIFASLESQAPLDLGQICSKLAAKGDLAGYEIEERFYEIGSFEGIKDFTEYIEKSGNVL
jgi:MurNAc alpha-1-phosphate uridylyltransferase